MTLRPSQRGDEEVHRDTTTTQRRLLIVGDSMTQGGEGDYTWRYRFWQWAKSQNINAVYVGPFKGTQERDGYKPPRPPLGPGEEEPPGPHRYNGPYARDVEKDFDSHHFSEWGKPCLQGSETIKEVLESHYADVVLVMLGFNDLGWFIQDVQGTLNSTKKLIDEARRVNPGIKLVIADIPQRTHMDGREDLVRNTSEYNELLAQLIPRWTTDQSPVYLAELSKQYTAETASYDGLHPNALGDYQIARAFADAFVDKVKIGRETLNIPDYIPERPLPTPEDFRMTSGPLGVTATWESVFGSQSYELRKRTNDGDFSLDGIMANRWDSHWATDGDVYEAQVRACYGEKRSAWTNIVSAIARPKLAPPPSNVQVKSTDGNLIVTWEAPETTEEITHYVVMYKDKARPENFPTIYGFKKSPAFIPSDLVELGHVYDVWMVTWTTGEGFFGETHEIKVK